MSAYACTYIHVHNMYMYTYVYVHVNDMDTIYMQVQKDELTIIISK